MKGGGAIRGAVLRVVLTSSSQNDNGGINVRLMSGGGPLEAREEGNRRKEGICQENNIVKVIPLEMSYPPTAVSLLQVYSVLTYRTSKVLYLG